MALDGWEIDTMHSGIYFSVHHMVVAKVRGRFERWSATILAEDDDLERTVVEVVIDASSLHTGITGRDDHLKSAAFFDVTNYPTITFRSSRVQRLDAQHLRLTGALTIRDVTREVVFEVEDAGRTRDSYEHERGGFTAKASIDRNDFGLTWNQQLESGSFLIGARVEIDVEIEVEIVRRAQGESPEKPDSSNRIHVVAGHVT